MNDITKALERLEHIAKKDENRKRICDQYEPDMSDYTIRFAWIPDIINYGQDAGKVIWLQTYFEKGRNAMTVDTFNKHRNSRKKLVDYALVYRARQEGVDV